MKTKHSWKFDSLVAVSVVVLGLFAASQTTVVADLSSQSVLGDETESESRQEREQEQEREREVEREGERVGETRQMEVQREGDKVQVEIQNGDQKLKIKTEGNKVETERETPEVKQQFHLENGQVVLKVKTETGETVRANVRQTKEVSDLLEREDIKVASEGSALRFEHGGVRTRTNFPLSVDPVTNQLVVTTPAGQRAVAVLPDDAIQNMIDSGVIIGTAPVDSDGESPVELEERSGELVYRVEARKRRSLFGLISVELPTTLYVSSETGLGVAEETTLLTQIVSLLSR